MAFTLKVKWAVLAGTSPSLGKTLQKNICEGKSRRTNAKRDCQFIDNSLLEKCQNKRITMRQPDGFIEVIEVGEIFFDVLRALIASIQSILSSLLQVSSLFKIVSIGWRYNNKPLFIQVVNATPHPSSLFSRCERFNYWLIILTLVPTLTLELFCFFRFFFTFLARLNFLWVNAAGGFCFFYEDVRLTYLVNYDYLLLQVDTKKWLERV